MFVAGIFYRSETGLLTSVFSLLPFFDEQLLDFNYRYFDDECF